MKKKTDPIEKNFMSNKGQQDSAHKQINVPDPPKEWWIFIAPIKHTHKKKMI